MPRPRRVENPPNPFHSAHVEWDVPTDVRLEIYEERAKTILAENRSPDIGFRYSLNPYRGCFHGCIYCYARPSHQYWDFGAGTDFDRKLVVKVNAPELLERHLRKRSWAFETIAFSGNTDCYQPLEASYELTRRCLAICAKHRNPVGLITKGTLIRRDLDVLQELTARAGCRVSVSIAFADDAMRKVFDPFAPPIDARFETVRRLAEAGVPVGVGLSPILPGINDSMVPEILERAREAGARTAFMTLARLPREVAPYFFERVREALPNRASKIENGLREMRGGTLNDVRFGRRMGGAGARWTLVERLFDLHVKRLGLDDRELPEAPPRGQLALDF
ncbi:MAG: PA0069 family radical SAM protein [Sandaracinaceae bacterium]|nr:PA0069 family radical SAM protein [Sandaracinaceae bacterium]